MPILIYKIPKDKTLHYTHFRTNAAALKEQKILKNDPYFRDVSIHRVGNASKQFVGRVITKTARRNTSRQFGSMIHSGGPRIL